MSEKTVRDLVELDHVSLELDLFEAHTKKICQPLIEITVDTAKGDIIGIEIKN
jgi:hypothetical protein